MISSLAAKCQHFQVGGLQFHYIKSWKKDISTLKSWHFEASEDIITKFKSQDLYTIKIKYWKASGRGFPPSLIPALQNIGILHHKKAKLPKHLQHSEFRKQGVSNTLSIPFFQWSYCFHDSQRFYIESLMYLLRFECPTWNSNVEWSLMGVALKETAPRPLIFYLIFSGHLEHRRFESADKQSVVVKILWQQICFGGSGTI